MYKGQHILAVVPARGGSKGVPRKNVHELVGKPLIAWTADLIKEVGSIIDRSIVSTDCDEIATVAKNSGLDVPFYRPESLSGDRVADLPVLQNAIVEIEKIDRKKYDIVLMLQPTSPLRTVEMVVDAIKKIVDEKRDAVWTVSAVDLKYHPLKQLVISNERMELYDTEGEKIVARQQLDDTYYRNGGCYAFTRSCLLDNSSIYGKNMGYVVCDTPMVSIDTFEDFKLVAVELTSQINKFE